MSTSKSALCLLPIALTALACGSGPELGSGSAQSETTADPASGTGASSGESGETGDDSDASGSETSAGSAETGEPECALAEQLVERDYLAWNEGAADIELSACDFHVWWVSAAAGTQLTLSFAADAALDVAISYPDEPSFVNTLASATLYEPGELSFESPRSGEFAVLVRAQNPGEDPALELGYDIDLACTNECGRETTRFPLVMVHGWTGFENIGPLTYFYNVQPDLEGLGYSLAIAVLDPYNAVEVRGEQLNDFVGSVLSNQRARKVNLIGHSQGGIDSRYVASEAGGARGDQVGAVVTIGTPHYGTPFTDIALGLIPGPAEEVLIFLLNFLGAAQDQQSDVEASLYTLSETFMQEEFNVIYVDDPRVRYYSWMGETCIGGIGCQDILDPLLVFSYNTIFPFAGDNDGLVPFESAKWGEFLEPIPADHIDQIGQIAGVTSLSYDHIEFFRQNARMLKDERL